MKFAPVRAAGIFSVAVLAPAIPFIAMFGRRAPSTVALVVALSCAIVFCLFWAGARVAGRPHTPTSLVSVILVTWSFTFATNGLGKHLSASIPYADRIVELLQFMFVFMAAWQMAPKARTSAATDDGDVAA